MLEQLRRNSRSFIIWILFGIIIAVFIISFGPQASPDSLGCGQSKQLALEVNGEEVSLNSWRFAMNAPFLRGGGAGQQTMRRQLAVDLLVMRELLAQAAEAQGFRISDEAVNQSIAAGDFFILGQRQRMTDPEFWRDYRQLEGYAANLGLSSVATLADEQRREHLAQTMRHLLLSSAAVSDEEARQYYINENTKVTADYVKFDTRRYKSALQLTDADIERYIGGHDEDLKKAWEAEKTQWASDKPRVLARLLFIAKDAPAKPDAAKPGDKPDAAKPAGGDKIPAKQRAEAARTRITGGEDFGVVAREVSEDRATKARSGLTGWRPADSLGQGKEVVDAVQKLTPKQVSDVIETERGFYIVRVEERSEKALTFEQKRGDLAARLAPDYYARELARRDAQQALTLAAAQPLEQLFERKASPGGGRGMEDLPPEVLEQLEQLKQGAGEPGPIEIPIPDDGKQGWIVREGPNVLAQSGGAPPPKPSQPDPAATPAKPAAPAGGTPAGAAPAGAAPAKPGSAAGAAPAGAAPAKPGSAPAGATPAKPAAPPLASAAGGDLPAVTVERPALQSVGPVSRMGDFVAGLGESEKLVGDLFENLEVGKIAPEAYELGDAASGGDGFAIVVLKSREDADVSKFDESREEIMEQLSTMKGYDRLTAWVHRRCDETARSGELKVNADLFREGQEENAPEAGYQPCASLSEQPGSRFRRRF
jgi:parvulin-like peptidyl-prolyl isomerase